MQVTTSSATTDEQIFYLAFDFDFFEGYYLAFDFDAAGHKERSMVAGPGPGPGSFPFSFVSFSLWCDRA